MKEHIFSKKAELAVFLVERGEEMTRVCISPEKAVDSWKNLEKMNDKDADWLQKNEPRVYNRYFKKAPATTRLEAPQTDSKKIKTK